MKPTIPSIEELELDKNIGENTDRRCFGYDDNGFARLLVDKGYVFGYDEDTALRDIIKIARTRNRYTYLAENGSIIFDAVRYNGLWYGVTDLSKEWRRQKMEAYEKQQARIRAANLAKEKLKEETEE